MAFSDRVKALYNVNNIHHFKESYQVTLIESHYRINVLTRKCDNECGYKWIGILKLPQKRLTNQIDKSPHHSSWPKNDPRAPSFQHYKADRLQAAGAPPPSCRRTTYPGGPLSGRPAVSVCAKETPSAPDLHCTPSQQGRSAVISTWFPAFKMPWLISGLLHLFVWTVREQNIWSYVTVILDLTKIALYFYNISRGVDIQSCPSPYDN